MDEKPDKPGKSPLGFPLGEIYDCQVPTDRSHATQIAIGKLLPGCTLDLPLKV